MHDHTMIRNSRVIQSCAAADAQVLSIRHEVLWPDGSRIGLHPVLQHGAEAVFLRALHHDGQWVLFDLHHVAPAVADDLHTAPPRDRPGTVLYGLRAAFKTADDFLRALLAGRELYVWIGEGREAAEGPCPTEAA